MFLIDRGTRQLNSEFGSDKKVFRIRKTVYVVEGNWREKGNKRDFIWNL
jgi:hypothetical protein